MSTFVSDNYVTAYGWPYGARIEGILVDNSSWTIVTDNDVTAAAGPYWWQAGIRQESGSLFSSVVCNRVFGIGKGYVFGGDNNYTLWAKNQMRNASEGLFLNYGRIGLQGNASTGVSYDNEWLNTSGSCCWSSGNETNAYSQSGSLTTLVVQSGQPTEPIMNVTSGTNNIPVSLATGGTGWTGASCPI